MKGLSETQIVALFYRQERDDRDHKERQKAKKLENERRDREKKAMLAADAKKRQEHYEDVDWDAGATTRNDNEDAGNLSDDFM